MSELYKEKHINNGCCQQMEYCLGYCPPCARKVQLILTYQNQRSKKTVAQLSDNLPNSSIYPCDVEKDEEIQQL